jgi:TolA-binding protein
MVFTDEQANRVLTAIIKTVTLVSSKKAEDALIKLGRSLKNMGAL